MNVQSSQYGAPNNRSMNKTTKILQGFLNHQRQLNRVIQNRGVIRSTNNSEAQYYRGSQEINCIYDPDQEEVREENPLDI